MTSASHFGADYVIYGWHIMWQRGLRRYAFIPLIINVLLFSAAVVWAAHSLPTWVANIVALLPSYLQFLEVLVWPLVIVTLIALFALSFSTVATLIAAPFNSILAEQVVFRRGGIKPRPVTMTALVSDIPRVIGRELQKLLYLLPRLLIIGLIALVIPVLGQLLWILFMGWIMTLQYIDYAFDNNHISFRVMRQSLRQQRGKSLSFGLVIAVLASIPGVNLVIMPLAVCGASALWVDHFQQSR